MILSANHIHKSYNNHVALHDVSIEIPEQSIFGLLGPNGAGKTTLIRILTQIVQADTGEVYFNGEKLQAKHIFDMGYLPEERGLYKKMKVGEQLLYFAELKGLNTREAKQKLKYWIDKFEIQNWLGKKVEELSKGMQQKVQFIATVLHEPKLIILDEPFSGFDPINAQLLVEEISLLKKNGASIIFSTHRMDSVEQLCDHIALINKSNVVLDGAVNEVKNKYKQNKFSVVHKQAFKSVPQSFELIESHPMAEDVNETIIKLHENTHSNKALLEFLQNNEVISFNEVIPSMEDIFIMAVEGSK
ncbi:MAG: ATP-binding cassette domain-containing protein [Bacteroidetes bacterium]|nr:ATP-binding cassette domain-containing protein [Bacteroidota bacterium]